VNTNQGTSARCTPEVEASVQATRTATEPHGAASLAVTDVTVDDLVHVRWAGSETHLEHIAAAFERVATGAVEYLAVRSPDGVPVSVGGIDYQAHGGAGTIWQLTTHQSLRSLGLGSRLVEQAESRIRRRGLKRAVLGVEVNNTRARVLYERLGYRPFGTEQASWEAETGDGSVSTHVVDCVLLDKELGVPL
jgi:ribosomal protein S18 acetylase RimI-like enzyme